MSLVTSVTTVTFYQNGHRHGQISLSHSGPLSPFIRILTAWSVSLLSPLSLFINRVTTVTFYLCGTPRPPCICHTWFSDPVNSMLLLFWVKTFVPFRSVKYEWQGAIRISRNGTERDWISILLHLSLHLSLPISRALHRVTQNVTCHHCHYCHFLSTWPLSV